MPSIEAGVYTEERPGVYQLFMLLLCVIALLVLAIQALLPLAADASRVLDYADTAICVVFLADFAYSLFRAPSKWSYFVRWGWIDLLSSIPTIGVLRLGRLARVARLLRLFRLVRSSRDVGRVIIAQRRRSTLLAAGLLALLIFFAASIAILSVEKGAGAHITTPERAVWWTTTTMVAGEFGDLTPGTAAGYIIAGVLILAGAGVFATVTGGIASMLVEDDGEAEKAILAEVRALRVEVAELRALQEQSGGAAAES